MKDGYKIEESEMLVIHFLSIFKAKFFASIREFGVVQQFAHFSNGSGRRGTIQDITNVDAL